MSGISSNPFLVLYLVEAAGSISRMRRIPKITAIVVALNLLVHLLRARLQLPLHTYGLQPLRAWRRWVLLDVSLATSSFLHESHLSLLANMLPFLQSGALIEPSMPTMAYLRFLAFSVLAPNALLVLFTKLYAAVTRQAAPYCDTLYTSFAAPMFFLSTVLNLQRTGTQTRLHGWEMPSQYVQWVEALIHQLLVPGSTGFSHVAGITAGYIWVRRVLLLRMVLMVRPQRSRSPALHEGFELTSSLPNWGYRSDRFPGGGRLLVD